MVKLDHEYDYKPVLLFKYECHRSWTSFAASHGTKKVLSVEMSTTLTVKVHNDRFDDGFWVNYCMYAAHKMGKAFTKLHPLLYTIFRSQTALVLISLLGQNQVYSLLH